MTIFDTLSSHRDHLEAGHDHGKKSIHNINRRSFVAGALGILSGIMAAILVFPAIGYLISPALKKEKSEDWIPLGPVKDLIEGEPTLFAFTRTKQVGWERTGFSYGVYVNNKPGGELDVFLNICTHLSCRYS